MNFWEAQRRARKKTKLYLALFISLTLIMAVLVELGMHFFLGRQYQPSVPLVGPLFLLVTFLIAAFQYMQFYAVGGSYVARSVGGKRIDPETGDPYERQLLNLVEEIAIASSLPVPAVFLIPANEINAFAAGLIPEKAAIAVTQGALRKLDRDELAGVVAHEFGHIYNGDMSINLRLAAMIMGFFFILILGLRAMQFSVLAGGGRREKQGANPVLVAALLLMAAGAVTWFAGKLLQASVSRQREYLADACSVQFTRQARGIAGALQKIAGEQGRHDMPSSGMAYAHLYFSFRSGLFATHPPIRKRIEAILDKRWVPEEWDAVASS